MPIICGSDGIIVAAMRIANILARRNRILLRELIITDFKLRYQGSVLGYMWSLLKPLFLFAILYVVFGYFLRMGGDVDHFSVYLLLGIVMWNFFTEATLQGLQSIVSRGDLIRKINFPKYIIIISSTTSALINLLFNLVVVLLFVVINGVDLHWTALLLPFLILEVYAFALAVAFFLAAFNVKFRDIGYLWEIFLQAAFYSTPILYSVSIIADKSRPAAEWMLTLNPVAQAIQDARYVTVTNKTMTLTTLVSDWRVVVPFVIIALVGLVAAMYFKKSSKYFAEYV